MSEETKLFVQYRREGTDSEPETHAWMAGADALVMNPCACTPEQFADLPVEMALLLGGDPERDAGWLKNGHCYWVCTEGLEATARLRERWPDLHWVPQLAVFKPETSYRFSGPAVGEGFSFYMPDTAAIQGWRVSDGDVLLSEAVTRTAELGFDTLWLHSEAAESRGKGLDLEVLDKVRGGPLSIWLSGGVSELKYLQNLARTGGASAVVVGEDLARESGMERLRQALIPRVPLQQVPIRVGQGDASAGTV
ncbi:MAG: hypothetical protein OQL28_11555 [Sedimenticola sp.]|nr:hypothetical protein [Sedimenticola sp.]